MPLLSQCMMPAAFRELVQVSGHADQSRWLMGMDLGKLAPSPGALLVGGLLAAEGGQGFLQVHLRQCLLFKRTWKTSCSICPAGVPCELLQHWDPAQPLLVGGLSAAEEGRGFLQLRLKRHRWFGRLLKTRDPLTFSVGWRRFQSIPVYATEDANGRHRCLVSAFTQLSEFHVYRISGVLGPSLGLVKWHVMWISPASYFSLLMPIRGASALLKTDSRPLQWVPTEGMHCRGRTQSGARLKMLLACRMLKYSPEHMHCLANIYGALAPPNTGILAVQSSAANQKVCSQA